MKFEALKRSAELNKEQEPSIFLALCMIESLFKDLRIETGQNIEDCDVGDESQFSVKLAYLCRSVNKIYRKKSDALKDFNVEIEKQMSAVNEAERHLDELTQKICDEKQVQEKLCALKKQVDDAEKKYEECENIKSQCKEIQRKIDSLKESDTNAAKERLAYHRQVCINLEKEHHDLSEELISEEGSAAGLKIKCDSISSQLSELRKQHSELSQKEHQMKEKLMLESEQVEYINGKLSEYCEKEKTLCSQKQLLLDNENKLQNELESLRQCVSDLQNNNESAQSDIDKLLHEEQSLKQKFVELSEDKKRLSGSVSALSQEIEFLCKHTTELQAKEIELLADKGTASSEESRIRAKVEKAAAEKETLNKRVLELKQQRDMIEAVRTRLENDRCNFISQFASLQSAIAVLEEEKHEKIKKYNSLLDMKDELTKENNAVYEQMEKISEKISILQKSVREMREKSIPEQENICVEYNAKIKLLKSEKEKAERSVNSLKADIKMLEANKQENDTKIELLNSTKAALTASVSVSNSEIHKLEEQLSDLRGKTDKERLSRIKAQLGSDIKELQQIQEECRKTEDEIRKMQLDLELAQEKQQNLENIKRQLSESQEKITMYLSTLEPLASLDYSEKVRNASLQAEQLKQVCIRLNQSVADIAEVIDLPVSHEESSLTETIRNELEHLQLYFNRTRKDLISYANICSEELQLGSV